MDEFIPDFLIEGSELLDQLDRDFVEFEKNPGSKELVARIFRAIHTLKGTSGAIGLKKLEAVNHVGESILSRMRDGKLSVNAEITSALLRMIDADRQLFASLESTGQEGDLDFSEVIQSLTEILTDQETSKDATSKDDTLKDATLNDTTNYATKPDIPNAVAGASNLLGEILVEQGVGRARLRGRGPQYSAERRSTPRRRNPGAERNSPRKPCRRRSKPKVSRAKTPSTATSAWT